MNREELAWAAGFFDGEGCTSLYNQSSRLDRPFRGQARIRMTLAQTNLSVLERFRNAVRFGTIRGPRTGDPQCKPYWIWSAEKFEEVQQTICYLWAWLSAPKRAQASEKMKAYRAARVFGQRRPRRSFAEMAEARLAARAHV